MYSQAHKIETDFKLFNNNIVIYPSDFVIRYVMGLGYELWLEY